MPTPEFINEQLRPQVRAAIPEINEMLRKAFDANDFDAVLEDFGSCVAQSNLPFKDAFPPSEQSALALAVYRNIELEDYMLEVARPLMSNRRLTEIGVRLQQDPDSVSEDDFNELLSAVDSLDEVMIESIRLLLRDPVIRRATAQVAPGYDFSTESGVERYIADIESLRKADDKKREALSKEAGLIVRDQGLYAIYAASVFSLAVLYTSVGVSFLVLATAVFVTFAAAVTDSSASGPSMGGPGTLEQLTISDESPQSEVINESNGYVWAVVRAFQSFRRVAIPPGRSSRALGLARVDAVLIGGTRNPVTSVSDATGSIYSEGAYTLQCDRDSPGVIVLRESGGCIEVDANDAQLLAEGNGLAGYSDLKGAGPAGDNYDSRYRMSECSAVMPEGFDYRGFSTTNKDLAEWQNAMKMAASLSRLRRTERP